MDNIKSDIESLVIQLLGNVEPEMEVANNAMEAIEKKDVNILFRSVSIDAGMQKRSWTSEEVKRACDRNGVTEYVRRKIYER